MSEPNSNATRPMTRADFLADAINMLQTLKLIQLQAGIVTNMPLDRAYIAETADAFEVLCASWRERTPRTCETWNCSNVVTEPLDVLCPSCKGRP